MEGSNGTTQKRKRVVRSVDDATCKEPTLLTLPMADFQKSKNDDADDDAPAATTPSASDEYILFQLPPKASFTVSDLMNGNARIIGGTKDKNNDDDDDDDDLDVGGTDTTSSHRKQKQACLIIESKSCTYELSRVETSNALVLVPPLLDPNENEENVPPPQSKKPKLMDTEKKLVEMPSRALGCNGSVASFLEMKKRKLNKPLLRKVLSKHVHDPYNKNSKAKKWGLTWEELIESIQCSEQELSSALQTTDVFTLLKTDDDTIAKRYGTLAEEAKYEALSAIVATLAECDAFANYGEKGFAKEDIVKEVMQKSEGEEECLEECVVRHCLESCRLKDDKEEEKESGTVRIDVAKIAIFLAHRLFNSQTQPWECSNFLSEWQRLMPGVGDVYQPKLEWLTGVSLQVKKSELPKDYSHEGKDNDDDTVYLKYVPENKLSMDPSKRFEFLFAEKEKWSLQELEPYVSKLEEDVGMTQVELLVEHTRKEMDEDGTQWYMAR